MSAKNKHEIRIERVYDAPVKAVWDAWTDPKQVAKWWGPRGFTITTHGKDLKPGGFWKYTMHGPDGTNYENKTIYLEVEKHSKLVYDHGGNDEQDRAPLFRVTVLFSELKGKTKMEMTMTMPSAEALEASKKIIKSAGGNTTWDRLGEFLYHEATGKEQFIINRTYDVPVSTMFEMWTNPKHLTQWSGPTGSTLEYLNVDIRTGGKAFYCMTAQGGVKMYGRVEYLEITKPNRLVYTQQFTDEKNSKVTRHPFAPTWPATMRTTVDLTEEAPNRTRVTITWDIVGEATAEEIATFAAAKAGMSQGWTGSLDKLEELLGSQK